MQPTHMKHIRFGADAGAGLQGYGYDFYRDRVVSFKRRPEGELLQMRHTYTLNYRDVSHVDIKSFANRAQKVAPVVKAPTPAIKATFKAAVGLNEDLGKIAPSGEYVLYSTKNRCSQYFFAGTSVAQALEMFQRRGETIAVGDIRILDVASGRINKVAVEQRPVYTLA